MPQEIVDEVRRQVRIRNGLIKWSVLAARSGVSVRALLKEARKYRHNRSIDMIPEDAVRDFVQRLGISQEWRDYKERHGLTPLPSSISALRGEHPLDYQLRGDK